MFKNILVLTDLTEKSLKALDVAVKIAPKVGSKITLLHVIEAINDTGEDESKEFYVKLKERARQKMNEIADRHAKDKLHIFKQITFGNRAREIVDFAKEQHHRSYRVELPQDRKVSWNRVRLGNDQLQGRESLLLPRNDGQETWSMA